MSSVFAVSLPHRPSFPVEIWERILILAAPDVFSDTVAFDRFRLAVLHSFALLRSIVFGSLFFWSSIVIDLRLSPAWLAFALQFAKSDLHLHLELHNLDLPDRRHDRDSVYSRLSSLLHLVAPLSLRWRTFSLASAHPAIWRFVHQFCADLSAPSISRLVLDSIHVHGWSWFDLASVEGSVAPLPFARWFSDALPDLEVVFASCVRLDWDRAFSSSSLTILELAHLDFGPVTPLSALLSNCASLRQLHIDSVQFAGVHECPPLLSTSIRQLRIGLPTDDRPDILHLVGRLNLPLLDSLTICSQNWTVDDPFLPFHRFLYTIRSLTLKGTHSEVDDLRGLFSCLRVARAINLSEFEASAFQALRDVTFRATLEDALCHLLPLTHLMLYRENLADVVSFVSLYHPLSLRSSSTLLFLQLDLPAGGALPFSRILRDLVPEVVFTTKNFYYTTLGSRARLDSRAARSVIYAA
ncbi:hypothetical protein B0H16DRAFT_1746979 [Mycena metata]|uniref:F-box domain-containing protein n=1 Tax=Mycena metata TaxID=1033252 RepID=A0AAD7GV26_9AGAR|nr:hypothetical protein B0H16DRAFT_1746979 [Mycena metata]